MLLGGWAAVAVAGAATAALASPIAAAVPTPAVTPPSPAASASARATASPGPSPSASADASGKPPSAPKPPAPAPDGSGIARPRLTTTPIGTRLQAQLDRLRARLGIPGVSATIVFRDGTSWTGVSGLADVARKVPVADDTAFAVGSISKTYTAALILALAGDGKIGLDKPAASYLPGFGLDKRITVRMLLDHTSGLDDFFIHGAIDTALQKAPAAHWSVARTLKYVAKPYFPPGQGLPLLEHELPLPRADRRGA